MMLPVPQPFQKASVAYSFLLSDLASMRTLLKNKAAIYVIIRINPDGGIPIFYIGSSSNVYRRLTDHKNPNTWFLTSKLYNSMKKYGIGSFQVLILDILDPVPLALKAVLLFLEQWYFDNYHPTLNILRVAGSSLGTTRTAESVAQSLENNPQRIQVTVTDTLELWSKSFPSIRKAATYLNTSDTALRYSLNHGKLYLKRYKIEMSK